MLTSLQIWVKVTFTTKHNYSSQPRSSSAGCSIFLMRAAMLIHGWLCLASAAYLKHCHLQVMRHSCTFNELITAQWCGYMQHVTFHFLHNQRQWGGQWQRETCSHPDATSHNVQKLSYADAPNGNVVGKCYRKNANLHCTKPCKCRGRHVYEQ